MSKSNKKHEWSIFKLILMVVEVMILSMIVVFFFTEIMVYRPEKSKVISEVPTTYSKSISETIHNDYLPLPLSKDEPEPPTFEEVVASYVFDICSDYPNVDPYLILSIICQESRFTPNVSNGGCVGLMQISEYWHKDRAARLGVTDFWDPYSNILLGVDLVNELLDRTNGDIYYALMLYNQTYSSAKSMYSQGIISQYAKDVVQRANLYKEGYFDGSYSSAS